jgi:hypothetical protein
MAPAERCSHRKATDLTPGVSWLSHDIIGPEFTNSFVVGNVIGEELLKLLDEFGLHGLHRRTCSTV